MLKVIIVALGILYVMVAIKVNQWFTISKLGLKLETPQLYMEKPYIYHAVEFVLFIIVAAAMLLYAPVNRPWYIVVIVLGVLRFVAFWIGRKNAFYTYRKVFREMIAYDDEARISNPQEYARIMEGSDPMVRRAELEAETRKTDRELAKIVKRSIKWRL